MKLISWNVNGLRACMGKGFLDFVAAEQPDMLCLQETKMQPGQAEVPLEEYHAYWCSAEKKGYSGTALFTRIEPLSVSYHLGVDLHDHEGRVITAEYTDFYLVTVYVPNSQDGLRRLEYRMQWEDDFRAYVERLDRVKPVVICGDMNVAHEEIDLKNPKTNRKNAGFTDEERAKMSQLLEALSPGHGGRLFLVELPVSRARKERRMADRLFSCVRAVPRARADGAHPDRRIRLRPLSGGDRN